MGRRIDRTGEINYNNFGSKMEIIACRKAIDIDIYFEEYDWVAKHIRYDVFKDGRLACPYEPRLFGIGYMGEGKYKSVDENGIKTKCYYTWSNMMKRCYDKIFQKEERPTYIDCTVCKEWHNFQNFAKWYEENYYEIPNEKMCLDKDILIKGNKVYSPQTCVFVPNKINVLFVVNESQRGNSLIGTTWHKRDKAYDVSCFDIYLGRTYSEYEGFLMYKKFREKVTKQVADEYKCYIPTKLYEAMYKYEVEIND